MHALPIPVYWQTDFIPKDVVVLRLHDTVEKFRTGVKFSAPVQQLGWTRVGMAFCGGIM